MIAGLESISPNQRRLLAGVLLLPALFLAYRFGLRPLQTARRLRMEHVREVNVRIAEAERDVASMARVRGECERIRKAMNVATNLFVLRPVLGSYPVQRSIHRLAGQSSFHVAFVREQGVQPTPRKMLLKGAGTRGAAQKKTPAKQQPAFFARYVVDMGGEGTYVDILDLIDRLEQENPYMGVLALNVRAVQGSPERHRVTMRLEWPVDAPPEAHK